MLMLMLVLHFCFLITIMSMKTWTSTLSRLIQNPPAVFAAHDLFSRPDS